MSSFELDSWLSSELGQNVVTRSNGVLSLYLEQRRQDTVLQTANVPVSEGGLYFGAHLHDLHKHPNNHRGAIKAGLAVAAEAVHGFLEAWEPDDGEPPSQVVGVTHLGLARFLAQLAGISCAEIPESVLYDEVNGARGWGDSCNTLRAIYKAQTTRGRLGKPLHIGVIAQPTEDFITAWRQGS